MLAARRLMAQRRAERIVSASAAASVVSGIITLLLLALPFLTVTETSLGSTNSNNATGYQLAQYYPVMWLILVGGAAAIIVGPEVLITRATSRSLKPARRSAGVTGMGAGALILIGCVIGMFQVTWDTANVGSWVWNASLSLGIGIPSSLVMGCVIWSLGFVIGWPRADIE